MFLAVLCGLALLAAAAGCGEDDAAQGGRLDVVASATFLADIAQQVAGDRFAVRALVPRDADLHSFELTPRDLTDIAGADLFIVNGAGLERTLEEAVRAAGGDVRVVEASAGLTTRTPQSGEPGGTAHEPDPHFWLDPTLVESYVATIRDAFAAADPDGTAVYEANAAAYVDELRALDHWIAAQVETVPADQRLLVMNHVSHGYYADRYGFAVVGAVIPSVGTAEEPTARQLAELTRAVRETGAKAVFVELGQSPDLATQIAAETGITVVDDLRDHSLSGPGGGAATYIAMMKYDTRKIVEALR